MFFIEQISEKNLDPLNKPIYILDEVRQIRKKSIKSWNILVKNLFNTFNLKLEVLNKNVIFLSGGEKQKISIIKGILLNPKILVLDESLSALDEYSKKDIIDFLVEWKNKTNNSILYITHFIKDLFVCDEVIFLSNGKTKTIKEKERIFGMLEETYSKEVIDFFLS